MVGAGNFKEFMERAMNDPYLKKKKVDEKESVYSGGTSKQAQTKAKAMLDLPAFKGVSDKKMAFAHLARAFDKLMRESIDEDRIDEALEFIDLWQGKEGDHKSSLSIGKDGVRVLGVIPHGSQFMFDKKDVPKLMKLLKMKDSPIIK